MSVTAWALECKSPDLFLSLWPSKCRFGFNACRCSKAVAVKRFVEIPFKQLTQPMPDSGNRSDPSTASGCGTSQRSFCLFPLPPIKVIERGLLLSTLSAHLGQPTVFGFL